MQLITRKSFCSKAIVTLLFMAVSTMLYAGKPDKPGSRDATCTITTVPASAVINAGENIDFTGSVSGKPTQRYNWSFAGGSPATASAESVTVTYTFDGTFDATLNGTNGKRESCIATTTITVNAGGGNQPPVAQPDSFATDEDTLLSGNVLSDNGSGVDTDPDGDNISVTTFDAISVQGASVSVDSNGDFTYDPTGAAALQALNNGGSIDDSFSYTISDNDLSPLTSSTTVTIAVSGITDGDGGSDVSINSTSQNGIPGAVVAEQPFVSNNSYKIFATNDLGMHCGDFDTRISSILPPFNILHAQVIRRGGEPDILTPADNIEVVYSAASNPDDPILTGINSAGSAIGSNDTVLFPVLSSLTIDGTVFKTNFWDIVASGSEPTALSAYRAFYPPNILDAFYPNGGTDGLGDVNILDLGLPMPNVERLWLGDGVLTAEQQSMPGILNPYMDNEIQLFELFTMDQPFFSNPAFPFGYVSEGVSWYEAAGVPLTAFDDFGRENPWPLYRVQAKNSTGTVVASTDIVVPISGEANCGACHLSGPDGGNGAATEALGENVAMVGEAPDFSSLPFEISKEYAADLNIVRLHDQKHGTGLEANTPVVCQSCHYTPALDLAQVGPSDENGRQQTNVRSMSNVMHSHHGVIKVVDNDDDGTVSVVETGGRDLFPAMLPAVDSNGEWRDPVVAREVLMDTCYQCHPGRRTDCLRGAMANGGMLCQDCHGDMKQVGDDFTRTVGESGGGFELAADFYTNPNTPRVPWANEPGCGSCHTGDAMDNMHGDGDTLGSPSDTIRLLQAYLTTDTKATPIVPTNKRFAENTTVASDPAGAGNPMLYRVSTGHEGVFCEACHGATHGIWPNKNPNANDNVTAMQLQGHTGTITECDTCHTGSFNIEDFKSRVGEGMEMEGPHGMHPVNSPMWNEKHKEVFELNNDTCRTCHGTDGKGTVLSTTATTRTLECKNEDGNFPECADGNKSVTVDRNTVIGCDNCHSMEN